MLAKSFFDHGVITDVVVVEHTHHKTHNEWYPGSKIIPIRRVSVKTVGGFIDNMDVMLFFETPFSWDLISYCKSKGVKTVLMPMYECFPEKVATVPDLYLCPSKLDLEYFPTGKFVPVPVEVSWKLREKARIFVHNAGHGGLRGRNGTSELIRAMGYVRSPIKLIIRSQDTIDIVNQSLRNIDLRIGTVPFNQLYNEGDVFIFPEKFNGLSLPLQEACASGMAVMSSDRFPMNTWLHPDPLIPVFGYAPARIGPPYVEFDEAIIEPKTIANTIDDWYRKDISRLSRYGKLFADRMSWESLKPLYMEALSSL